MAKNTNKTAAVIGTGIAIVGAIVLGAYLLKQFGKDTKGTNGMNKIEKICRERYPAHYTDEIQACIEGKIRPSGKPIKTQKYPTIEENDLIA